AQLEGDVRILLAPDHENGPLLASNHLQLLALIRVDVALEIRKTRTAETSIPELDSIAIRPFGKPLRMQEVAELTVRPSALVENRRHDVPHPRHGLDRCQRLGHAKRRVDVDERSYAVGKASGNTRDDGPAERQSAEVEGAVDVHSVEQLT